MTLRGEDLPVVGAGAEHAEFWDEVNAARADAMEATLERVRAALDEFLSTFNDRIDIVTTDDGSFLDYVDHEQVEADLTAIRAALGSTALETRFERRVQQAGDLPVSVMISSAMPAPPYRMGPLYDPTTVDPCSCDEALALRAQLAHMSTALDKAERRAALWRQAAHVKHRLLHMAEPVRFDSQLERPVRGG